MKTAREIVIGLLIISSLLLTFSSHIFTPRELGMAIVLMLSAILLRLTSMGEK